MLYKALLLIIKILINFEIRIIIAAKRQKQLFFEFRLIFILSRQRGNILFTAGEWSLGRPFSSNLPYFGIFCCQIVANKDFLRLENRPFELSENQPKSFVLESFCECSKRLQYLVIVVFIKIYINLYKNACELRNLAQPAVFCVNEL